MKIIVLAATVAAVAVAVPAQASKPADTGPSGQAKAPGATSPSCAPKSRAWIVRGTHLDSSLEQTKGADTPDVSEDDRWSGLVAIEIKRANKHGQALEGKMKEYEVTNVVVQLADRDGDGTADLPASGDRMQIQGKITFLRKGCTRPNFRSKLTIRKVKYLAPPAAKAGPASITLPAPADL